MRNTSTLGPPVTGAAEIKPLTGLRGLAASLVMLYHFNATSQGTGPGMTFVRNGYLWVDMFFIISGFIMALSFANMFLVREGGMRQAYWLFLARRLARIYPLYMLVTMESALAALRPANQIPGLESYHWAILANIGMFQAWDVAPSFDGAAWSISTEWAAYLLFPVLLTMTLVPRRNIAIAVWLGCLALIALLAFTPGLHYPGQTRMGPLDIYNSSSLAPLIRCLAEFCLGLLAYRWFIASATRPGQRQQLVSWSVPLFLVILSAMTIPDTDIIVVALFPVLVAALALQACPLSLLLSSRIPVWLGQISYSLYLLHGKFVRVVEWNDQALRPLGPGAHPVAVVLTGLLVCVCATVVYHKVERPCRTVMRRAFEGNLWLGNAQTAR